MSFIGVLVTLAVVVILVLTMIAGRLLFLLYQQQKNQRLLQAQQGTEAAQQRERINQSIQILARALQGDELTLTEASIRIATLLDSLEIGEDVRTEFSAFYQLRERTAHIPILAEWKALDRHQQKAFDQERLQHEQTYADFVRDAARRIDQRSF